MTAAKALATASSPRSSTLKNRASRTLVTIPTGIAAVEVRRTENALRKKRRAVYPDSPRSTGSRADIAAPGAETSSYTAVPSRSNTRWKAPLPASFLPTAALRATT
jgi:hypothetical protein